MELYPIDWAGSTDPDDPQPVSKYLKNRHKSYLNFEDFSKQFKI